MKSQIKETPKIASKSLTNAEIFTLSFALKNSLNMGLGADSFLNYIELSLKVDEISKARAKAIKLLMNGYGIKEPKFINGHQLGWVYDKHPKKVEITEKLDAISKVEHLVSPTNFMSGEEFKIFTSAGINGKPLDMGNVVSLSKILLKQ